MTTQTPPLSHSTTYESHLCRPLISTTYTLPAESICCVYIFELRLLAGSDDQGNKEGPVRYNIQHSVVTALTELAGDGCMCSKQYRSSYVVCLINHQPLNSGVRNQRRQDDLSVACDSLPVVVSHCCSSNLKPDWIRLLPSLLHVPLRVTSP